MSNGAIQPICDPMVQDAVKRIEAKLAELEAKLAEMDVKLEKINDKLTRLPSAV